MKCVKYDDLIDKLMTCAYSFKRVETWEDIVNIINEVPTFDAVPAPKLPCAVYGRMDGTLLYE